jgi:hypothetical protein
MSALDPPSFANLFERSGLPVSWRFPIVSLSAMITLAGLDFMGTIFAKEWAKRHQSLFFVSGLVTFVILFVVYAHSLRVAELSFVTIGWVVFLQVGIILVDRMKYGVELSPAKWCAVGLILALQAFLILAPSGNTR